jgi:hypothetical protein
VVNRLRRFPPVFGILLLACASAEGQQTPAATQPPAATQKLAIGSAWNMLLQGAVPESKVDPALTVPQVPATKGAADDILNHFFYETRTEYIRENTYFTSQPTATSVINVAPGPDFNPNGIPYPQAFQPSANQMYSFMDWGTRGWLSDRVNTHFSVRYRQDLSHLTDGSPQLSVLNTFGSNRLLELTTGYVEINGRPTDGMLAGTSLQLGRIDVYGAELASFDGAAFTVNRRKYTYTLFGGRRYSYFSDPDQRAVGGGNFLYRLDGNSSFEYNTVFYIKGTHNFSYRRRFGPSWLFSTSYKMIGGSPVDFNANAIWTPSDGKTMFRVSYAQKITNKDYFYDYTLNARDLDPHNPLLRLYLGPFSPHSDFIADGRRAVTSRLRVGGTIWVRRLNDSKDEGPFDTSFTDYHVEAQVYPGKKIETFFDYRQHNSDRSAPFPSDTFDDVSIAGETRIQDVTAQVGRTFGEGNLSLRFGGFYRRINFQDRFFVIQEAADRGLLGNATVRLDQRTRVYFDYSLDTDLFVFRPSIRNSQIMRVGLAWRY